MTAQQIDESRDLTFERRVDLTPGELWAAWTEPELLPHWFCPRPWTTQSCQIDLRPGGLFATVMRSPEGQEFPNLGCYLEVIPERRLVWTNALGPGFRPVSPASIGEFFLFTARVEMAPDDGGALYRASVVHATPEDCARHAAMGFSEGWGKALDQLVEFMSARRP